MPKKMKRNKDCPFCKPNVLGETFLESKNFRAVYNVAPILPGHSMIVPKSHIKSMMELGDKEICEFVLLSRDAIRVLQKAFRTKAFNWGVQDGEAAGQTVSHLHIHIIPRSVKDLPTPGSWYPRMVSWENKVIDSRSRKRFTGSEMKKIVAHLKGIAKGV